MRLKLTLATLFLSLASSHGTIWMSNGTPSNIQSIHDNNAVNGDTIRFPNSAGTFVWTTGINITKAITLQGKGIGLTIVKYAANAPLITWSVTTGQPRFTSVEFQDQGGGCCNYYVQVNGTNAGSATFRMDHVKHNNVGGLGMAFDTVIGVMDHCEFVIDGGGIPINGFGTNWNGGVFGDKSWTAMTGYGTSKFFFIENNTFTHSQSYIRGIVDAYAGARMVIRYNSIFNGLIANHGTESTGRSRGCRAIEVYNNTFTGTDLNNQLGGSRSGGTLFHDNTVSGYSGDLANFNQQNFRSFYVFDKWGGADATSPWDVNDPVTYFTGSSAGNSVGVTVTVAGNPGWTTDQWTGYTLRKTSDVCGNGSVNFGWIRYNTSNTLTYDTNPGYPPPSPPALAFCNGDSLEIRRVIHPLDGPGRAGGLLITGDPPVVPAGWPPNNQITEPCYSWNNLNELGHSVGFTGGPGAVEGVHFFNNTAKPGYVPYVYPHPRDN